MTGEDVPPHRGRKVFWRWSRISTLIAAVGFLAAWAAVELLAEPGTQISLPMGITYVKGDGVRRLLDGMGVAPDEEFIVLSAAEVNAETPPGSYFRECPHCPLMVIVPAGVFEMGASKDDADAEPDEFPVRTVSIGRPFAIAVFETTMSEWDAGVRAGALPRAQDAYNGTAADFGWGRGRRPVINVGWADANSYTRWLNEELGASLYRLPSEAEWEYAARAGADTPFTFGKTYRTDRLSDGERATEPVGSYPANRFGLHDVQGNVWEWTADCWHETYERAPSDGSAWVTGGDCTRHSIRGGSWGREPAQMRLSNRYPSSSRGYRLGFRVVREIP